MPEINRHNSLTDAPPLPQRGRRWLQFVFFVACVIVFVLALLANSRVSALPADSHASALKASFELAEAQESSGDFSTFAHTSGAHSRLPCLLCHRREDNSPRPKLPGHMPCAGCHAQQFANSGSPICAICHTDRSSGAVKSFPALKSFNVRFDHARHLAGAARPAAVCAACHQPARGGRALSIPAGPGAHSTCYQCHQPRAEAGGRDISSCSACHQLGGYTRTLSWARAYGVNFSHAKHGQRQSLNCTSCHSVRAGLPQGQQMTAPVPLHHHAPARAQSCMSCHNGKRAFGGDDFTACRRCHQGNAWHF